MKIRIPVRRGTVSQLLLPQEQYTYFSLTKETTSGAPEAYTEELSQLAELHRMLQTADAVPTGPSFVWRPSRSATAAATEAHLALPVAGPLKTTLPLRFGVRPATSALGTLWVGAPYATEPVYERLWAYVAKKGFQQARYTTALEIYYSNPLAPPAFAAFQTGVFLLADGDAPA